MSDVLNRTTLQFKKSVNTPDYPTGDWVVNPDMSPVAGVAQKYWKLTGDIVSEMTQAEKDAVDDASTIYAKTYKVLTYNSDNSLTKETWYATDNGDGTYADKAEDCAYTYDASQKLVSKTLTIYYADNSVHSATTTSYYENDQNEVIEKVI